MPPLDVNTVSVYLVRHGETDWNREDRLQGSSDVPLNATGRQQIAALAQELAHVTFDAAFTSPLARAVETARAIIGNRPVPLHTVTALGEFSYGTWQGLSQSERETLDPALASAWRTSPWSVRFPQGETLAELHHRVSEALREILAGHGGKTLLVSAHGHVNRIITLYLRQLPAEQFWTIPQPNASYTHLVCPRPNP